MRKLFYILSLALALFPLLKLNHYSIVMIVWFVCAIFMTVKTKSYKTIDLKIEKKYVVLILPFVFYLASFPFVEDTKELGKIITKTLPLFVIPIGFLFTKKIFSHKFISEFCQLFVASIILINIIGWIAVFREGFFDVWNTNSFYHPMFRTIFSETTQLHIPYLGMLSTFSVLLLICKAMQTNKNTLINIFSSIFLLLSMYIYSARMALIIGIIGITLIFIKSVKSNLMKFALLAAIPLVSIIVVWFSPLKERYINSFDAQWIIPHADQQPHEVNYRYGIWYCSSQIIKDHLWLGVGADQAQNSLNNCYQSFTYQSYEDFSKVTYNSHNQYVDWIMKFGILFGGLLSISLFFFLPKSTAIYQLFVLTIVCSFLTENILDRQIGVVFYSLFQAVLLMFKKKTFEKNISS